jgi:hypothetical protein
MHDKQERRRAFEQNCGWVGSIERDRVEIVMMNNMLELKIILHDL